MPTITSKDGTQIYPGAPHGMCSTRKDEINADLLAFVASSRRVAA